MLCCFSLKTSVSCSWSWEVERVVRSYLSLTNHHQCWPAAVSWCQWWGLVTMVEHWWPSWPAVGWVWCGAAGHLLQVRWQWRRPWPVSAWWSWRCQCSPGPSSPSTHSSPGPQWWTAATERSGVTRLCPMLSHCRPCSPQECSWSSVSTLSQLINWRTKHSLMANKSVTITDNTDYNHLNT